MDLETQLQFLTTQIQSHTDAIASLQAIKDTLTEKASIELASLAPLQAERDSLIIERDGLKSAKDALEADVSDLTTQVDNLVAANEQETTQPIDEQVTP